MDVETYGIKLTLDGAPQVATGLENVAKSGDAVTASTKRVTDSMNVSQRAAQQMGVTLAQLTAAANGDTAAMKALQQATGQVVVAQNMAAQSARQFSAPAVTGFRQLADAQADAGKAAGVHGLNLGRLNMELGTAIGRFSGVNTAATRFAAMLGGSLAGYSQVIGFLAAAVALSQAYKAWHVEADEARDAQEKLTKSLLEWYDAQSEGGTRSMRMEIEATTQSVINLQAQLDKLSQGKASGLGIISQAPGGVISSILRIATAGNLDQMVSQFATEIGKGAAKVSATVDKGNAAIDAATTKIGETLNSTAIATAKQAALNDAFNSGAYALGLINLAYEHRAALAKNAIEYTGTELAAANRLTDAFYAQQQRAAALTEAQRAMIETWENADKLMAQLSERLKSSQPEWAASARQYEIVTQQLAAAATQALRGTAALGARNTSGATTGLNSSAAEVQHAILKDAQDTARAIEESVNAAVQLGEAFKIVDKNLGAVIGSLGEIVANIKPLLEQIKAFKVPDGKGGNLGSALGLLGAISPIVGGIAGLVGAFTGFADAAKQAKAAQEALKQSIIDTTNAIRVALGQMSDVDSQIVQAEVERKKLDAEITASIVSDYFHRGDFDTKKRDAAIDAAVAANDALYKAYEDSLRKTAEATDAAAKAQQRLNNIQSQNNSQLRIFNATGQSDAAFDLQQLIELEQATADGLDEISIALLKDAQNAERAQREREKQTEILQNQLSTAQQTADALKQIYDSLDQFSKSLDVGQYSPLSPRQQLDSSRGSLNALYQAALGGDQAAAGQFSGAAQSFLDASRKYNASGAGYVLDFNSVKVMTDALKKQFGSSLTDAQKQVSLLQQQLDELKRIAGGMDTLVSRPNLTPQVPDPIPVGGSGRPRIEAGTGAPTDDAVFVFQAGMNAMIDAQQGNTAAVADGFRAMAIALDTLAQKVA